jgi:histidinol-phosphate aminotransferase
VLDAQAAAIRAEREVMLKALSALEAVEAFPSRANFILFRLQGCDAGAVFESIRHDGVLIKNMNAQTGALKNCLRVTVGRPEENAAFLEALKKALAA